jgi:hypothetical protein
MARASLMGWNPNPLRPWTRSHEKFVEAFAAMTHASARRGLPIIDMAGWLERNYGVRLVRRLTVAQARKARRSMNAWRAGIEGLAPPRAYPRQWRRNQRRAAARRAANITAGFVTRADVMAAEGLKNSAPCGLIPTDSTGNS